ncbi:MAG: extracellular solute-binding protein [Bacteroides sp.]|nr:extracellular solute-binding protein [Prevotella sp.]MCM1407496.1 extracellular solute-binding protein [Treponema brennaborense]MCM1469986.1 extracellular solute-binding protein [Bacteroides sp.]
MKAFMQKPIGMLFGVLLGLMCGCSGSRHSKKIELSLWTHEDINRSALERKYIAEFQEMHPEISVKYIPYPSAKIKDILVSGFAANNGPDIFNIEINDSYPFVANGRVAPVIPEAAGYGSMKDIQDAYINGVLDPITENGKIYGLPLELTNWCVYVNKNIFRDAHLDPEKDAPRTWEDIVSVSKKIALRDGEIIIRRGFDFRYPYYLISWLPMVEQLGGRLFSADGKVPIINDEAWLTAFRFMADFGPAGENLGSPTYTPARKIFDNNANEIAMSLSGLYQQQRIFTVNKSFYESGEWAVLPYPQWKNAKEIVPCHYYGHYYMVNAQNSPERQKAAWQFIGWLLSHSEEYLKEVCIIQPLKSLFESKTFKDMPYSDVFKQDLENGTCVYFGDNSPRIDALLKNAVESVMLSGIAPEKALETLKKNMQEIIDEN